MLSLKSPAAHRNPELTLISLITPLKTPSENAATVGLLGAPAALAPGLDLEPEGATLQIDQGAEVFASRIVDAELRHDRHARALQRLAQTWPSPSRRLAVSYSGRPTTAE